MLYSWHQMHDALWSVKELPVPSVASHRPPLTLPIYTLYSSRLIRQITEVDTQNTALSYRAEEHGRISVEVDVSRSDCFTIHAGCFELDVKAGLL